MINWWKSIGSRLIENKTIRSIISARPFRRRIAVNAMRLFIASSILISTEIRVMQAELGGAKQTVIIKEKLYLKKMCKRRYSIQIER